MALYDEADVTPESSTGTEVAQGADPSAGTLNTGQPAPPPEQTVPYARFHEVNTGYRQAEARAAAAEQAATLHQQQLQATQQRLQTLEGQLQQRATQTSRTPEQERDRQIAQQALDELNRDNPNYARIEKAAQLLPEFARMIQAMQDQQAQSDARLQQAEERAFQGFARGETGRLQQMATRAGLTFQTPEQFQAFEDHVTYVIGRSPQALAAFQAGDARVLPEAFKFVRQQYAGPQQQQRAALAATKAATGRLPRPLGGGVPGAPQAPEPKFDPADPGGRERAIWKQIRTASSDIASRHAG